ncbi:MAG: caspase domain-containing protein, partial [Promethearchaeota archaeon]
MEFKNGYALLIAVDDNEVKRWALPAVSKDIAALDQVLKHPNYCAYPEDNVKVVSGKAATRQGILKSLEWLQNCIKEDQTKNSTGLIYYTGHGWRDDSVDPPTFYLIPYDMNTSKIRSRALNIEDFAAKVEAIKPRRLLVIFDCCHSGGMEVKQFVSPATGYVQTAIPTDVLIREEESVTAFQGEKSLTDLTRGTGRAILSSSQGEQPSFVRKDEKMSIFTFHLIEALTGHAQPQDGATEVLVSDIMSYVWRKVPESAQKDWGKPQDPDYKVIGNFPVALLLGGKEWHKDLVAPNPINIFSSPGLVIKLDDTIKLLSNFIDDPSQINDSKAWKSFKEFILLAEQFSMKSEIEYEYDELKR